MAKGGNIGFTGGTYNAGKIVIDANEALKAANDLDAALKRVGTTLTNMARGHDVSALWNEQAASIDNVSQALERFRKSQDSVGSAEDLVKAINAFSAWHPDQEISSYFKSLGADAESLISKAKDLSVNLNQAFDIQSLREAFDVFNLLKQSGVDLERVFTKLRAGDVSALTEQAEILSRRLANSRAEAEELREQLNQFESGGKFAEMNEKLIQFEETMDRAKEEFKSFLSASGFAGLDLDERWGKFSGLFDQIREGSMTVKEAMAQVREEYSYMFQSAGSDQIMEVLSKLEQLSTALDEIRASMSRTGGESASMATLGDMRTYLDEGAEAADRQTKELAELSLQSASLQGLVDVLLKLAEANRDAGEGAVSAHGQLIELVNAVQQLGNVDVGSLEHVSDIMKSFVRMDGISVGKASVDNLIKAFESLSRLPSTSNLAMLSAVDFSNLNNLKVSKASLEHLTEALPVLAKVDVSGLKELASIDWSNLTNLKMGKSTADSLRSLSELYDSMAKMSSKISVTKQAESEDDAIKRQTDELWKNYNAWKQANEEKERAAGWKAVEALQKEEEAAKKAAAAYLEKAAAADEKTGSGAAAEAEKAAAALQKAQVQATALAGKIDLYLSKNGAMSQNLRSKLQGWSQELRSGAAVASGSVNKISADFKELTTNVKIADLGGKTFFQTLQDGWRKFGGWSLVSKSFMAVIRTFKQAVTAVKEVDSAMTELRKVTDLTAASYERFYKNATDMASRVGAKLSDTINAVADFSRLGYDIKEATSLAEASLVYFNVGDELENISEATEAIISAMKAFGVEARDAMTIVDKFNEVGKKLLPMPVVTRCLAECYIGQSSIALCA